jgi:hypothetical protein
MKKAKCWIVFIFIALGLISLHSLVSAQDKEAQTLRRLQGVMLTIVIDSELLEVIQVKNQLQIDVELRLRMAGINVVGLDETSQLPGTPELVLNVDTYKVNNAFYISNIVISLDQDVRLIRNNAWARGITWIRGGVAWTSPPTHSLINQLRRGVKDGIDGFINAYLSVNPK